MRNYVMGNREEGSFRRKIVCAFLVFAAALFSFSLCRVPARAEEVTEEDPSKAVAIVFDNSGSMFTSAAWCRAIYSMEVFAAMAEEGDEIAVYPFNSIEVNGVAYTSELPLTVTGGGDVSVIREIYTPSSMNSYIETLTDAYGGLLDMAGEDKWLIVLTDADVYYENDAALDPENGGDYSVTEERLNTLLTEYNDSVNVVYVAIGDVATIPTVDGSMYSDVVFSADSAELLSDMIGISDTIYGREEISVDAETLEFTQPVSDLVLFVQGADIGNLRLADADGLEAAVPVSTCSPLYAEAPGSGNVALSPTYYAGNEADIELAGEIVTYGAVPAGTYTIEYDGTADSVEVYCASEGGSVIIPEEPEETEENLVEGELTEEELAAENARAEESRHSFRQNHRALFWVLIILVIAAAVVVLVVLLFLNQRALPQKLSAKIVSFVLNGDNDYNGKRPYLRYTGGGKPSGSITIGPRPGTTDFDYKLTLELEACSRRFKKSGERGAVIVSLPSEIGYLRSYTIDNGEKEYTVTRGDTEEKKRVPLGKTFTYTMLAENDTISDDVESVQIVIEMEFH